ncbi:MAG: NAD-dependent deacylase [Anaerolineae bacterium]|nr:NAD-dependent deacylase [Anaerolineae bacterium]
MTFREQINDAAELLQRAKHTVAFTGAGISTPSGIPDFRSQHTGLWENVDPMAVASMYGFRQNPQAFYNWIYPLARLTLNAQPNPAHLVLANLEKQGRLDTIITQNIDMLHTRAGNTHILELHGHLREATCVHCFTVYPAEPIIRKFLDDREVPHCPKCGGVIKPNVILFGEQLPVRELQGAKEAARHADLMLVVGSSLEVAPAGDLPLLAVRNDAKLIIINIDPTPVDSQAQIVIHADAAEILPDIMHRLEARIHES